MRTKTDIKLNIINISTIYKNLNKRNQLTDDQPNVKHLEVGGGWEDLPHLDDDRCHDDDEDDDGDDDEDDGDAEEDEDDDDVKPGCPEG